MKLLVISDTHFPTRKNLQLEDFFSKRNYDYVIHCGDFDTYDSYQIVLNIVGDKLLAVYGNMDDMKTRNDIPEFRLEKLNNISIGIIHSNQFYPRGNLDQLVDFALSNGLNILFYGHTHKKSIVEYENGIFKNHLSIDKFEENKIYLINPGSLLNDDYLYIDI